MHGKYLHARRDPPGASLVSSRSWRLNCVLPVLQEAQAANKRWPASRSLRSIPAVKRADGAHAPLTPLVLTRQQNWWFHVNSSTCSTGLHAGCLSRPVPDRPPRSQHPTLHRYQTKGLASLEGDAGAAAHRSDGWKKNSGVLAAMMGSMSASVRGHSSAGASRGRLYSASLLDTVEGGPAVLVATEAAPARVPCTCSSGVCFPCTQRKATAETGQTIRTLSAVCRCMALSRHCLPQ